MDRIKAFYNNNKKTIIIPTVVMLCICIIITLALSVTNAVTAPAITKNTESETQKAMKSVLKADAYFKGELEISKDESVTYHTAKKANKTIGYIFTITENGYGGDMSVMISVNTDLTINSVCILDASSETPGLGQNVKNEEFYSQFEGKEYGIKVVKSGTKSAENEIDAVTSATISSKAVTNAVNKALKYTEMIVDNKGGAK
ncbi:MAG: RnfABCDGE type electron transport complex subunit G [Clostridia bacterium]|nr:RnfABCDGE type electron transport complex subunit G [Clostridia bacterium]